MNDYGVAPGNAPAIGANKVAPVIFEDKHNDLIIDTGVLPNGLGYHFLVDSAGNLIDEIFKRFIAGADQVVQCTGQDTIGLIFVLSEGNEILHAGRV